MCSHELPRAAEINYVLSFFEQSRAPIAVEYHCFILENLYDKSGKVTYMHQIATY